jgi:hypothetical protein
MKEKKNGIERRDFFKASGAVLGGAVLTAANFSEAWAQPPAATEGKKPQMPQDAEPAVAYGQVHNPEMLGDAFNAMVQIHGITRPYQHKFNDALVKAHLSYLEFLIKSGKDKEYLQFDLAFLSPLFKRVKGRAKKAGKDYVLTGMFEGTGCSFLLYEKIYKRPNERLIVCPFREGIGHNKFLKTTLTIEDVCNKYCIPRWTGHGKACGVEVKVKTGEICSIKIS